MKKSRTLRIGTCAKLVLCGIAVLIMLAPTSSYAVRVSVKRLVFEEKSRSQVVVIINNSAEEQTYRLGWQNYRMTENKMLEAVPDGELGDMKLAEDLIRFAPQRLTIPPGESRQVRVMAKFSRDLEDGEYRSHLNVSPEEKPPSFSPQEEERAKTEPVVKVSILTGISVPVFVRKGALKVQASFSAPKLTKGKDDMNLSIVLNREGSRSLYGDIDFVCVNGEKEVTAHQVIGIAVYTDVSRHVMNFDIPYPEGGPEACNSLRVSYIAGADDSQYKGAVIAEAHVNSMK